MEFKEEWQIVERKKKVFRNTPNDTVERDTRQKDKIDKTKKMLLTNQTEILIAHNILNIETFNIPFERGGLINHFEDCVLLHFQDERMVIYCKNEATWFEN